jgi:hypothetical protein
MKYFTPERFVRLQDLTVERTWRAAALAWEQAGQRYRARLQQVLPRLPSGLRRLLRFTPVHDAEILSISRGRSQLTITLRPAPPAERLVVLRYTLTEPPRINRTALPERCRSRQVQWLYDELDLRPASGLAARGPQGGSGPVFTHAILLSNGWEIQLRFRRLTVSRPCALLPGPEADGAPARSRPA